MAMRVICVKAPRGLRGLLRLFSKEKKTVSIQQGVGNKQMVNSLES